MCANFLKAILRLRTKPARSDDAVTGSEGESLAARHLTRRGMRIVERNWRCPLGEVDLVCRDGDMIVFVEVKASRRLSAVPPQDRVGPRKQQKLQALARYYLKTHYVDAPARFDVVAVWWEQEQPQIQHFENAFQCH